MIAPARSKLPPRILKYKTFRSDQMPDDARVDITTETGVQTFIVDAVMLQDMAIASLNTARNITAAQRKKPSRTKTRLAN